MLAYTIGDKVKVIDPFSQYFEEETTIVEVCGIRRIYYHVKIDGEENDWKESQLKRVSIKDPNSVNVKK